MKKISKEEILEIRDNYKSLSYEQKIEKYKKLNNSMKYGALNESDFIKLWGYSFSEIEGFDKLSDTAKKQAIQGILNLTNNVGMECKADYLVYKIGIDRKYASFIMYHATGYSYTDKNGSVG